MVFRRPRTFARRRKGQGRLKNNLRYFGCGCAALWDGRKTAAGRLSLCHKSRCRVLRPRAGNDGVGRIVYPCCLKRLRELRKPPFRRPLRLLLKMRLRMRLLRLPPSLPTAMPLRKIKNCSNARKASSNRCRVQKKCRNCARLPKNRSNSAINCGMNRASPKAIP